MTTEQLQQMVEKIQPEKLQNFINTMMKDEAQMEALQGKNQEEMIKLYMECRAKRDDKISRAYNNNKLGKTSKDCYRYLEEQIRKMSNSRSCMVSSTTVFKIVENYFTNDEIKKAETPKPNTSSVATAKKPVSDSEKEEQWEVEHKQRIDNWEKQHNEKIDKWNNEHRNELFYDPLDCPNLKDVNPYLDEKNPYSK